MHHLILVRHGDGETSGSGCCGGVGRADVAWNPAGLAPARGRLASFGKLYRTLRDTFGERLEITVLDPRNLISYVPLVARDAVRYRVPWRAALRAIASNSRATGVLDGRLLYTGTAPDVEQVLALVRARLEPLPSFPAPVRTGARPH